MKKILEQTINFDSEDSKRLLYAALKGIKGIKTILVSNPKRTNEQLKYYFVGIVKLISEATGDDPTAVHAFLKRKFLLSLEEFNGSHYWRVMETEELDVVEFSEYIEKCIVFASEVVGVIVMDSTEYLERVASLKTDYLSKIRKVVNDLPKDECLFDKGKLYFYSEEKFDRVLVSKDMSCDIKLTPSKSDVSIKVIKYGDVYGLRLPASFRLNGRHTIKINDNSIRIWKKEK